MIAGEEGLLEGEEGGGILCQEAVGGGKVLGEEVTGAGAERVEARSRAVSLLMLNKWEAPESGLKSFVGSVLCVSQRNDSLMVQG